MEQTAAYWREEYFKLIKHRGHVIDDLETKIHILESRVADRDSLADEVYNLRNQLEAERNTPRIYP